LDQSLENSSTRILHQNPSIEYSIIVSQSDFRVLDNGIIESFLGFACFAWNNADSGTQMFDRRLMEAAGALAITTTLTGVLYLVD
jgi:hypothetical protein